MDFPLETIQLLGIPNFWKPQASYQASSPRTKHQTSTAVLRGSVADDILLGRSTKSVAGKGKLQRPTWSLSQRTCFGLLVSQNKSWLCMINPMMQLDSSHRHHSHPLRSLSRTLSAGASSCSHTFDQFKRILTPFSNG